MAHPKQQTLSYTQTHYLVPHSGSPDLSSRYSLNWRNLIILVGVPLGALISLLWVSVQKPTIWFAFIYGYLRGLVITTGYHRLWAHKSYTASTSLKLLFAVIGAGAAQNTIKKWCRDHRAHHRYVDTDLDPYNIRKGFFHAHIGWMLFDERSQAARTTGRVDISDLTSDPIVEWQHQNYFVLVFAMAYVLPTVVCGLCFNDFPGGFVVAGCLGTGVLHQVTFCVNSLAHWAGTRPFQTTKSPRDNAFTALLTFGEGFHNFHHEFPIDYRNGVRWYNFDPTKWVIWTCSQIGLASNLRRFPLNEIEKGRWQRRREKLEEECEMKSWKIPLAELPVMEWEEYRQHARTGRNLVVIKGVVYNVSKFATEHPGGSALITGAIGEDATEIFGGGVHDHSPEALNLLSTMRIARVNDKANSK